MYCYNSIFGRHNKQDFIRARFFYVCCGYIISICSFCSPAIIEILIAFLVRDGLAINANSYLSFIINMFPILIFIIYIKSIAAQFTALIVGVYFELNSKLFCSPLCLILDAVRHSICYSRGPSSKHIVLVIIFVISCSYIYDSFLLKIGSVRPKRTIVFFRRKVVYISGTIPYQEKAFPYTI